MNKIQAVDIIIIGRSISGVAINLLLNTNKSVAISDYLGDLCVRGESIIFPTELNKEYIHGAEFEDIVEKHLIKYKKYLYLKTNWVKSVYPHKKGFLVIYNNDITLFTSKIVFAPNGTLSEWSHVANIKEFYGWRVSQDAWSDAPFSNDTHVVIAGYGDRVLEQANWLTKFSLSTTLICPNIKFSFSNQYQQHFQPEKRFKMYENCSIQRLLGKKDINSPLTSIRIKKQNTEFELECSGLFLADPVTICWEVIGSNEEINKWIMSKKLFLTGIANKISYSDHKALYLDGKRCVSDLLKSL